MMGDESGKAAIVPMLTDPLRIPLSATIVYP